MKKKLRLLIIPIVLCMLLALGPASASGQAVAFRSVMEKECEVTANFLNIRTGPGTQYPAIGEARKGQLLDVIGSMGQWYVVVTPDGSVGVVSAEHVKISKIETSIPAEGDNEAGESEEDALDASDLFALVNKTRIKNRLSPFVWDDKLNTVVRLKAEDMKTNNYFSHQSPNYGTPFNMLKQMGVLYKTASENIAANPSVEAAHEKMMLSTAHSANILNPRYNKMGIGVVEYQGTKIIVQIFVEE